MAEASAVVAAMDAVPATYVDHAPELGPGRGRDPGADPGRVRTDPVGSSVDALGERRYWGLLRIADAMLGNSSSALIEAPAVGPAGRRRRRSAGRPAGRTQRPARTRGPAARHRRAARSARSGDAGTGRRVPPGAGRWSGRAAHRGYHRRMATTQTAAQAPDHGAGLIAAPLIVLGGGEHARVVIDAARTQGDRWAVQGYVAPDAAPGAATDTPTDLPWLGDDAALATRLQDIAPDDRPWLVVGFRRRRDPGRPRGARRTPRNDSARPHAGRPWSTPRPGSPRVPRWNLGPWSSPTRS